MLNISVGHFWIQGISSLLICGHLKLPDIIMIDDGEVILMASHNCWNTELHLIGPALLYFITMFLYSKLSSKPLMQSVFILDQQQLVKKLFETFHSCWVGSDFCYLHNIMSTLTFCSWSSSALNVTHSDIKTLAPAQITCLNYFPLYCCLGVGFNWCIHRGA